MKNNQPTAKGVLGRIKKKQIHTSCHYETILFDDHIFTIPAGLGSFIYRPLNGK